MQNDDSGGAQTIVIKKFFLPLNNFRHADILYFTIMQFSK